jgi:hypothetical protein
MASATYRIAAGLPATIQLLPALVAFKRAGIAVATNYPTLRKRVDPELDDESDDSDEVITIPPGTRYPVFRAYDELSRETGLSPDLESVVPKLVCATDATDLIKPEHHLTPKRYTLVAVTAPDGDRVPRLRDWVTAHVYGKSVVFVVLKDNCPRFPYSTTLGKRSELEHNSRFVTPPDLGEALDAIAWAGRLVTTEYWAMYAAFGYGVPVDFVTHGGDYRNRYDREFWFEAQDRGYQGYEAPDLERYDLP